MSKRRKRFILLVCGIFALIVPWQLLRNREPSYQGLSLSEWIDQTRHGGGFADESEQARIAIRTIGTNAIPTSLKWISFEASPFRNELAYFVERFSPRLRRVVLSPERRAYDAMDVFGALGPEARTAIPELTRLAQISSGPERADRCVQVLKHLGLEALPSIFLLLTNSPPATRRSAMSALPSFGTNAAGAIPIITQLIGDSNLLLAIQAVDTISTVRIDDSIAFQALTNALRSASAPIRERAIGCVLRIRLPRNATATLLPSLSDPDYHVRSTATNVFRIIAPEVLTKAPPQ